jgi:Putative Actinobacterial Holin-X, holin superfamily III
MIHTNGRACDVAPAREMRRSISHLGSDIITLVELQAELLQVDVREWARGFVKSVIALVAALVLLLASAPILLVSLGYFINEQTDLSMGASMLIASGAGILLAGICAGLGVWLLKRDQGMLHRFSSELKQNMSWLKQVLTHPSDAESTRVAYPEAVPR